MQKKFSPEVGGMVSRDRAEEWIKDYDHQDRMDKDNDTISVFFGRDFLQRVIDTDGAAGVTFFFVRKPNERLGKKMLDLVLVPRSAEGKLLWPNLIEGKDQGDPGAYDKSEPCPPNC